MTPAAVWHYYLHNQSRLPPTLIQQLHAISPPFDPLIIGTQFEQWLYPHHRHQMGAHYTQRTDIELLIQPVLMQPLLDEWEATQTEAMLHLYQGNKTAAHTLLQNFADKIATLRILDPACGSGNFLYIALQHLLDLQNEVMVLAEQHNLPPIPLTVSPQQLHGMEINVYAHELAQVTIWMGYIQWRYEHGLEPLPNPILRPLNTIQHMDAILAYDNTGQPYEPDWMEADVIIGNPPFLGSQRLRGVLGQQYINDLLKVYQGRMAGLPDLVCYWFEKARVMVTTNRVKAVGLLATQAIRGGVNRQVLRRIVQENRIFMAWSDRAWVLAGAMVHVSLIGFDKGSLPRPCFLNGQEVKAIHANLRAGLDLTQALKLTENNNLSFQGGILRGKFNLDTATAQAMLQATNGSGRSNQEVITRHCIARDITGRMTHDYIIDFGVARPESEAQLYELPYEYVKTHVYPSRQRVQQKSNQALWWLHGSRMATMRQALAPLSRYIATPRVGKHRLFVWLAADIFPDTALVVFPREDDYFLGVLHSTAHALWARHMGTQLRDATSGFRYTPTTCFETFPFPWPLGQEPLQHHLLQQIALTTRQLVTFRDNWLNPLPNLDPLALEKRTLTHLYNALACYRQVKPPHENAWAAALSQVVPLGNISPKTFLPLADIETLHALHQHLDRTVLAAYGSDPDFDDDDILQLLLALNLKRAIPH